MSVGKWILYNKALNKIPKGTMVMGAAMRMALVTSASNFATKTLSLLGSLTTQVTEANGYSSSGKALASEGWIVGASAGQYKLSAASPIWTATGGAISNIKAAVLFMSGASALACHMLAYCSLTSSQFTLSIGNTLTVNTPAAGFFTAANG